MKEINLSIQFLAYDSFAELSDKEKTLCESTIKFAKNAYAPYSKFKVSACALLNSGEIVKGTNVENASYPVGICAERNVLSHVISNFPNATIETLAIYVDKKLTTVVPPCGLCRQSLLEAELRQKSKIKILLIGYEGNVLEIDAASTLLPISFDGSSLD